ncbi:MAG: hypothetical protein U9Q38_06410 [Thermodesulfobacteriota bacterium]|nr:hypothetical protein [Thermodesulfobacteriota bacterium]
MKTYTDVNRKKWAKHRSLLNKGWDGKSEVRLFSFLGRTYTTNLRRKKGYKLDDRGWEENPMNFLQRFLLSRKSKRTAIKELR